MLIPEKNFAGVQIAGARPYQEDAQIFVALDDSLEGSDLASDAEPGERSAEHDSDVTDSETSKEDESKAEAPNAEDAVSTLLVILSDGMGGENAGDVASRIVVDKVADYLIRNEKRTVEKIPRMLRSAALVANDALAIAMDNDPSLEGMGSTLLAVVIYGNSLCWVSVGDSPLYLYRDGELTQINEDHSMMPLLLKMVEAGELDPLELAIHPDRNVLRSAMIGDELEMIDCPSHSYNLLPGDIVIVASDGLQTLDDEAIRLRLDRHKNLTAEGITKKLLKAVVSEGNPKQDNTSINVICIPSNAMEQRLEDDVEMTSQTRMIRRSTSQS